MFGRVYDLAIIGGGITGAGARTGSHGASEPSMTVSHGSPSARMGECARLMRLPNGSLRERGLSVSTTWRLA